MNNRSYGRQHLKFLLAAVIILVMLDRFAMNNTRPYIEEARKEPVPVVVENAAPVIVSDDLAAEADFPAEEPLQQGRSLDLARVTPEIKLSDDGRLYDVPDNERDDMPEAIEDEASDDGADVPPQWQLYAVPSPGLTAEQPKVVIVIDDMGVSRGHSREVLEMDGPLTLAFLPYAEGVAEMAAEARAHGHELMVHMPMEPMNGTLDTGPIALKTGQAPEVFADMLAKGLGAFEGYVGMNNHMGSRLTQDDVAMQAVMAELHRRGLLFLDSRTIAGSVAGEIAAEMPVPYAVRDVFLDDDTSLENVRESLLKAERIALEHGQAIAIGHPKPNTIAGLREWLPTLQEKGIALVPISAVVVTEPEVSEATPEPEPVIASDAPSQEPEQPHP